MYTTISKKIIFGIVAVISLVAVSARAQASTVFNTNPIDFSTVRVSNYTQNPGCSSCWSSSVSATAGQVVSVTVYYHNTGSQTATDTRIRLSPKTTVSVNNQTFSGGVSASNASAANGSATITISGGAQTLTYIPGTLRVYKDQSGSSQTYSTAQENELFAGVGVSIGDISPDSTCPISNTFCHQGSLVARFQVSNTTPTVYACSDHLDNDGDGLTDYPQDPGCLSTTDTNEYNTPPVVYACSDSIDNDGDGLVDMNDPGCSSPTDTNEYNTPPVVYACNNGIDDDGDGLTDYPQDPGCFGPTDTNEYNAPPVVYACNNGIDDDGDGLVDMNDPGCLSATDTNEYNTPPVVYACNNGIDDDGDGLTDYPQDPGCTYATDTSEYNVTNYVTASTQPATSINQTTATLQGSYSTNTSPATVWFEWGTTQSLGFSTTHRTVYGTSQSFNEPLNSLAQGQTYYFKACASTASASVNCGSILNFNTQYQQNNAPAVSTTSGNCNVSQNAFTMEGFYNANGSATTTYFLYGTSTPNQTVGTQYQGTGSGTFSYTVYGLSQNTTYYFQAVAQNAGGTSYGTILSCTTSGGTNYTSPQAVTQSATNVGQNYATMNGYATSGVSSLGGSPSANYYFEYGTSYSLGSQTSMQYFSGSQNATAYLSNLSQNTTYYYRLVVSQSGYGLVYGSILSFVTNGYVQPPQYGSAPEVTTITATSVAQTSARLNGYLVTTGNVPCPIYTTSYSSCNSVRIQTQVWFEWGTTQSLGYTTNKQSLSESHVFNDYATGLSPNTTYYFRAMAQNSYGTAQGNIMSFTTTTSGPRIIYVGGGTGGTGSLIMLEIHSDFAQAQINDILHYTVKYRNLSTRTLKDVVVQVILPQEETFSRATRGDFSLTQNTLTVLIGDLRGKEEGTFELESVVNAKAKNLETLVATATLVYTHPTTKAQEDAIAYDLVRVMNSNSSLTGLALFGGGFLPNSLVGWLIIILIVLLLVYVARRAYIGK